jgi:hypothetical protein
VKLKKRNTRTTNIFGCSLARQVFCYRKTINTGNLSSARESQHIVPRFVWVGFEWGWGMRWCGVGFDGSDKAGHNAWGSLADDEFKQRLSCQMETNVKKDVEQPYSLKIQLIGKITIDGKCPGKFLFWMNFPSEILENNYLSCNIINFYLVI